VRLFGGAGDPGALDINDILNRFGDFNAKPSTDEVQNRRMSSATRGVSARVETDVAMALAASWNPLV
jgi:hypothetical protein